MKVCIHCKIKLGMLDGEGVICPCGELFVLCAVCIKDLAGANCPACGDFSAVFDDE